MRGVMMCCSIAWLSSAAAAEPLWSPDDHQEIAIHVGIAATHYYEDYDPKPTGPAIDLEVGLRHRDLSLLVYADVADGATGAFAKLDARYIGWGVRAHVHYHGALFGGGLGVEFVHRTSDMTNSNRPIADLHAGYTLPKLGPIAPEVLFIAQYVVDPFGGPVFASTRLEIGAAF